MRRRLLFALAFLASLGLVALLWFGVRAPAADGAAAEPERSEVEHRRPSPVLVPVPRAVAIEQRAAPAGPYGSVPTAEVELTLQIVTSRDSSVVVPGVEVGGWQFGIEFFDLATWRDFYVAPSARGRTDAEGRISLRVRAPSLYYFRLAEPDLCLVGDPVLYATPADREFTLVATRAVPLRGRVLSSRGRPISGAYVAANQDTSWMDFFGKASDTNPEGPGALLAMTNTVTARTGKDGSYSLGGYLPRTGVIVRASASGYGIAVTEEFDVGPVGTTGVPDLVLEQAGSLRVVVRTRDGALRDAFVVLRPEASSWFHQDTRHRCDSAGRVEIPNVPPGEYQLEAGAAGHANYLSDSITIESGVVSRTLVLERGVTVTGHVLSEAGAPVEGAVVQIEEDWRDPSTRTDALGEFRIPNVRTALGVTLWVEAQDFLEQSVVLKTGSAVSSCDFVLKRGGSLEFDVRRPDGTVVESFQVMSPDPTTRLWRTGRWFRGPGPAVMQGVEPGRCDVVVRAGAEAGWVKGLAISSTGTTRVRMQLEPVHTVEGRLLDGYSGQPLGGVRVSFQPDSALPGSMCATTDSDGRYKLRVFDSGSLSFDRAGYEGLEHQLPLPRSELELHPSKGASGPWWHEAEGSSAGRAATRTPISR